MSERKCTCRWLKRWPDGTVQWDLHTEGSEFIKCPDCCRATTLNAPQHDAKPQFESDCDRECKVVVFKAGYALPVQHSKFCKHAVVAEALEVGT